MELIYTMYTLGCSLGVIY